MVKNIELKTSTKILLALLALPPIIYLLGPSPKTPVYRRVLPKVPELGQLDEYVRANESKYPVKPENNAEIIWANPNKQQTEYAVVYLHGFSASHEEGNPAHIAFAKQYNCNLYLSRLAEHGLTSEEPMLNLTAEKLWDSAVEAYAIGRKLGKKVILMGTSNGATLALKLASEFPEVNSLILYSPNIEINNPSSWLLNNPWGLQIARQVTGSDYIVSSTNTPQNGKFWYNKYRLEAAVQLEELLETTMNKETFQKIKQPVLVLYYFKDDQHQDDVVRVDAMLKMFDQLGTPDRLKRKVAIPNAGNHVIGSSIRSSDVNSVTSETRKFADEVLKMK